MYTAYKQNKNMTKFMSQPFDSLKKFISSPLKTDTTFSEQNTNNQVHHRFATEGSTFEKQQLFIDNSSHVSFHKPPISRPQIDEFFQLKKMVNFYTNQVRQKAKVREECQKKLRNLQQQREDLEERIKAKKSHFSFKKMGLESKKKKLARNRRERGHLFNEETKELKNKILKMQVSNYERLKTATEQGKYSIPYTDSNPTFSSKTHQRINTLKREPRGAKSTSKTKIVVPVFIPFHPHLQHQYSPAHAPYSYSAPHRNMQNSSQNYGYFLESSRQLPLQRQETGQFSFADHFGGFKTQLSKTVSKRSEDSHIIPESALSSKRMESSIRQSRKSSGQSSKKPLRRSKNIHFYEDEVENQTLENPPSSQLRKTKNSQEDEMLLPPQLIKKKTYQDPKLPLIYEEPNNSTLHVSLMGQTDKQSLEEGKQSPAIPIEKKPPSRPRPNRESREASSKEQSAVAFQSKYMAEIKSISDKSHNDMRSSHFRVNSNMGNSVQFSPRKEQKVQNQSEKGQLRFNLSAGFKGEPQVSSHYQSTFRQNKISSEEDPEINFQKLSEFSRADREKLAVQKEQNNEEDDLLSAIQLSTESRISRQKNLSKSNISSARNNSTIIKSDEEGKEGDKKTRRRTIHGKDQQKQSEQIEEDLRISTPTSAIRDKLGIPQSRLTQSKKTMMNLNTSIVQASEGEEEMVSTNRKRRHSREQKPRSQR